MPDWRHAAKCRDLSPESSDRLFHADRGKRVDEGRRYCNDCPVRDQCLAWALAHPYLTKAGIYGGTTERERRALRRQASAA